jgi:hypothetical protein
MFQNHQSAAEHQFLIVGALGDDTRIRLVLHFGKDKTNVKTATQKQAMSVIISFVLERQPCLSE